MTIKVFLLDDHEVVRAGLRALLESHDDITVVAEAGTVAEAFDRVDAADPDVAVLDGRLPDGSGIEVCREFRSRKPSMGALILTSYDDDEAVFAAIMAGASGYLLKQAAGKELVSAIRHVAEGGSLLDATVTEKVMKRLREGDPAESDQLSQLTPQERRILELVGEGLTNRQIGERMFLAEKTVKNYMSSVLAKLGVERRTQAALFANKLLKRGED